MADKKGGLPSIINQEITKRNFLKGVLGTGGNTLLGTGLQALPTIIKSVSSSSPAIKATIPLLTEFFTIKGKIKNLPIKIWGKKVLTEDDKIEISNAQNYYDELLYAKQQMQNGETKLEYLEEEMKNQGFSFDDYDELNEEHMELVLMEEEIQDEISSAYEAYDDILNLITTGKPRYPTNSPEFISKKGREYIKKVMEYKDDQNSIRIIAEKNKVPFNYFTKFIDNDLKNQDINKKSIKDSINTIVSDDKNYGQINRYNEDKKRMDELLTPAGLQEAIEKNYQFYKNTKEGGVKGWKDYTKHMTPQEAEAWQKQEIKKNLLGSLKTYRHMLESNPNLDFVGSRIIPNPTSIQDLISLSRNHNDRVRSGGYTTRQDMFRESRYWDTDNDWESESSRLEMQDIEVPPSERRNRYKKIKEDLLSTAKTIGGDIAKDYIKEQFVETVTPPRGALGRTTYKPGPWLKKLADYVKSLRTSKAPSGTTIESDKVRAEQAKEVKEVKQKVTPKRNLVQDLKGVGKVIKASPYVAATLTALTPTELDPEYTAELPLETSPRGYGVRRENRGRSSRDPNKNYNTQRFI